MATLCLFALLIVLFVGWQITRPLPVLTDKSYTLERGQNAYDFAEFLENDGVLDSKRMFILTTRWGGFERNLKAGEYQFPESASILTILGLLEEGSSVNYPITIIEGWTFRNILDLIWSKDNIEPTLAGLSDREILDTLKIPVNNPEGWFFPDTFHYTAGDTDASILLTAYESMRSILNEEWENRAFGLPYKTPYEVLIAASIIQKESYLHSEYSIISGVIINRIKRKMRLQMDPTVIYGMGDKYKGKLLKRHLKQDTPYNTYTRRGLPPTPIAMPGRAAIHAAFHPAHTDALYFVAQGDGSHKFTNTLDAHNRAVREMRKRSKKN